MSALYHDAQFPLTKFCRQCSQFKTFDDFGKDHRSVDGYRHNCKECRNKRRRKPQTIVQMPFPLLTLKTCPRCEIGYEDPSNAFSRSSKRPDGLQFYCKKCYAEIARSRLVLRSEQDKSRRKQPEWQNQVIKKRIRRGKRAAIENERNRKRRASDPTYAQKHNANASKWYKAHPLKRRASAVRRHTRKLQVTTEVVSYEAILAQYGRYCYICEQPISLDQKLEFDHIIPLQPRSGEPQGTHSSNNIKPVHQTCNRRKANRRFEDLTPFDKRGPN